MRAPAGLSALLLACLAADAAAQTPEPTPPVAPAEPDPPVEPTPPPEPEPPPPPPPPRRDPAPPPVEKGSDRPEGRTMAIGAGWNLGSQDLMVPNTASVRFRFPSGLTLEPSITLAFASTTMEDDFGGVTTEDKTTELDLILGTLLRYPLAGRGPVDFVFLGGASVGLGRDKNDPAGPASDTETTTLTLGLDWGLGLELYFARRWCFSFDALNPLVSVARTDRETSGNAELTTTISGGAVFDPSVRAMFHLYFD